MRGRIFLRGLFALVVIAGVIGIGVYAYNAGVAQGMAASGEGGAVAPYRGPFFFPWFGFGFFCLPFLLLWFLFPLFGMWRGRWGWGKHRGDWGKGAPPMFEEWHRRAHEPQSTPEQK